MIVQLVLRRRDRGKPKALAISAGLHVGAFFTLMYAPPFSMPSPSPTEYQQAFAGKEDKIIWYKFRDLPEITPQTSEPARQPLRAEVKASQTIVSSQKNAPKLNQVILTPSPVAEVQPLDLPNLLAVKLPPKQFTTPPDLVKPELAKIEAPVAPEKLTDQDLQPKRLPKAFLPPPTAAPKQVAKIEAPVEARVTANTPLAVVIPKVKLPARAYVPPPPREAPARSQIGAAVEVASTIANAPITAAAMPSVRLPARAFAPPSAPAAQEKKSVTAPQIDATPGDVTIAIAGLNPATTPVKLPAASSPAQFSAGQTVRPDGAASDGQFKGISVPDLYARGTDSEKKSNLLARGEAMIPSTPRAVTLNAMRVSNAPDPRFNGRDVYMMAIQMSNLTSYSGSWLMWYAARTIRQAELEPISAPVPHRKVDPKYIASAVSDHAEGRVQLFCVIGREGNVSSIELVRGADERLNRSAEEALSKWEFYPATRNGQPVDVDVVVEIPFTLAPPTPSR